MAAALLLASLMSSGIGLVFVVAATVRTLLDPPLRRRALAVVPPLAAYLVWYAWAGHGPVDDPGHIAPPLEIARFVARGVAHSTAAVTGIESSALGQDTSRVSASSLRWLRSAGRRSCIGHGPSRRPRPWRSSPSTSWPGPVRAHLDFDYAVISRYVYVAGFLLALALADVLELLRERIGPERARHVLWAVVRRLRVRLRDARERRASEGDAGRLPRLRPTARARSSRSRGSTTASRWVDPQSGYGVMPPVHLLVTTVEAHGSPTQDRFFPSVARTPPPAAYEEALLVLVGDRFRVEPASALASAPVAVEVGEVVDAKVVRRDDCLVITAAGPRPSATLLGPDGARFRLSARAQRADHRGPRPRATARHADRRRPDALARRSTSSSRTSARCRPLDSGSSWPAHRAR